MQPSTKRRLCSLLLAFLMVLSLTPAGQMSGNTPDQTDPPASGTDQPGDTEKPDDTDKPGDSNKPKIEKFELKTEGLNRGLEQVGEGKYRIVLEPDSSNRGAIPIAAEIEPNNAETKAIKLRWSTGDKSVAGFYETASDNAHTGSIYGAAPGKTTITITAEDKVCTIDVEVSGIRLSSGLAGGVEIKENQSVNLKEGVDYELFGNAKGELAQLKVTEVNNKRNVFIPEFTGNSGFTVEGREEGTAMIRMEVAASGHTYRAEFPVTIAANESIIEYKGGCSTVKPLKFSELESQMNAQCQQMTGDALASVIDLRVPSSEGTLYLGYKSPEDTGAGVGSSVVYYARSGARGPYISDITFLPNASFKGETATITYTGKAGNGRTFRGKIVVTLTDEKSDLTVKTRRDTPLKLTGDLFSRACQEAVGSPLDYVIFTLPPSSQGALYLDYKDEYNYAGRVSATERYTRAQLDRVTFVPAKGYVGEVRVSYAGYSVSGNKYAGELIIQVQQGLDDAITYHDNGSGSVTFSSTDFDAFCENATGYKVGTVSFVPPPASQGVLYTSPNAAVPVTAGQVFGQSGLDRVTFVAANGFDGVVRIAFTGTNRAGTPFQGTVEIHIQSKGTSRGDISYVCAEGQSVKLQQADFARLCETLTGQRLHYISFQTLPDFNQGALYHNRTSAGGMGDRVKTSGRYYNSASPYISNLSFWATQDFRGSVDVPFTGCAVNGQTFTAIMTISNGSGAGSGFSGAVAYQTTGQSPALFKGEDFDAACRQATNEALSYVRFSLPPSGQGVLCLDYASKGTSSVLDPSRSFSLNGNDRIDRVAFVPAGGFAGTVSIPYTGWSIRGQEFQGTVQVNVRSSLAMGGLVRYETTGAPVHIDAYGVQQASGGVPVSLRLTGLPLASQGKLYYDYRGPTSYSWQGNTTTQYSLYGDPAVSNLTFVPKAGYYGEVSIPYTASNQDGSSYDGVIRVNVTQPMSSANFDDLAGYSAHAKSSVDYLYAQGVVNGVGQRKYDPSASIRRGDFCLMLSRAFQFNVGSGATGFTDVPAGAYYAQAVNQLYALGVVNGVGGGKFNPSASVSRQDAALMVRRTLQQAGISVPDGAAAALAGYSDGGQVSSYALSAVAGLAQLGLMPSSGGKLSPKADLTRVDMAMMLHRAMTQ